MFSKWDHFSIIIFPAPNPHIHDFLYLNKLRRYWFCITSAGQKTWSKVGRLKLWLKLPLTTFFLASRVICLYYLLKWSDLWSRSKNLKRSFREWWSRSLNWSWSFEKISDLLQLCDVGFNTWTGTMHVQLFIRGLSHRKSGPEPRVFPFPCSNLCHHSVLYEANLNACCLARRCVCVSMGGIGRD